MIPSADRELLILAGAAVAWCFLHTALINVIASAYLMAGTLLEEEKLLREFGDRYRDYQRTVPMLVPWKWALRPFRRVDSQQSM